MVGVVGVVRCIVGGLDGGGRGALSRRRAAGAGRRSSQRCSPPHRTAAHPVPPLYRLPVPQGGDVRELDFRFFLGDTKIGAPFHGLRAFFTTPQVKPCVKRLRRAMAPGVESCSVTVEQ